MEQAKPVARTVTGILFAVSFCHLLNDMMQSLLPAIYPMIASSFHLDFGRIGLITFTYQITGSALQPVVGFTTDRRPQPYSLPIGMGFTLAGLVVLALADGYWMLLAGAALMGVGSAVFHPESSRVARMASGGRHGLAQSVFQVGGNFGSSLGPLLAAFLVLPYGQISILWVSMVAVVGMAVLTLVGRWYNHNRAPGARPSSRRSVLPPPLPVRKVLFPLGILIVLIFSKYFYLASFSSYYTFYLMDTFGVSTQSAQIHLFVFLGAVAAGTVIGGPIGDRFGRKLVIWVSILGVLPFTLILPYANLLWTGILSVPIGLILASAFSAILVYSQDLMPGRVGMVAGLMFGLAFGMGGIGAAALGKLADLTSIATVYHVCAFLPALGILTALLPNLESTGRPARAR